MNILVHAMYAAVKRYFIMVCLVAFEILLIGSLVTFHATDSSWFYHATTNQPYHNLFGSFGANFSAWILYIFGRSAILLPVVILYTIVTYYHISLSKKNQLRTEWDRAFGVMLGFLSSTIFCQIFKLSHYDFSYAGGIVGSYLVNHLFIGFDSITQKIITMMVLAISFVLVSRGAYIPALLSIYKSIEYCCDKNRMPAKILLGVYNCIEKILGFVLSVIKKIVEVLSGSVVRKLDSSIVEFEQEDHIDEDIDRIVQDVFWQDYLDQEHHEKIKAASSFVPDDSLLEQEFREDSFVSQEQRSTLHALKDTSLMHDGLDDMNSENSIKNFEDSVKKQQVKHLSEKKNQPIKKQAPYSLPSVAVKKIEQKALQEKQDVLAMQARLLEEKLEQFDIKGTVVGMHSGPVVTLFEYQPDIKVKVSRILALEDDLAMALKALSIRIIAPIPGRSVVGFEVANQHRQDVVMSRILQSQDFKQHGGKLPLVYGQDTLGNDVIADLAKMPHLLIAGSTGSGKSVALNAMLVSLLCSLRPDQLKLIIIDPKRLEFAAYDGIAHLLFPIVTETKKAIPVLKWVVQTMEERYEIMARFGVRNLGDYQIAAQKNSEMEPMPFIVVIIDELADLMMTAGKAVEDSIARIAQMARAAGIHMIIATQRPSVDVITGMIKVNFPNRVAFKVTSKIDSRTILDAAGAEKLLGRGDMLFLDASKSHLVRVHGAYISDQEIHDVVAQIKKQAPAQYLDLQEELGRCEGDELLEGDDELYQEIIEFIQDLDEVSISMLQRRFRIGYNRSARIISMLESKGLIMSIEGGKTRRVIK